MSGDTIVQILLGLLVLVVGWTGYVSASRATRSQARSADKAVDAGAFERAKDIYEDVVATLRSDLAATRIDLLSARGEITGLREEITRLRAEMARISPRDPGAAPGGETA